MARNNASIERTLILFVVTINVRYKVRYKNDAIVLFKYIKVN